VPLEQLVEFFVDLLSTSDRDDANLGGVELLGLSVALFDELEKMHAALDGLKDEGTNPTGLLRKLHHHPGSSADPT
jgi:hypothetical protein